ncbi:MAG: thioredoxin [Elusimicrobia bacterium]|nr:thioredoxin [Elusimicrobiota bacterium]MBU2614893.1 thioredoxin [Elusimicrobiota bacterium]
MRYNYKKIFLTALLLLSSFVMMYYGIKTYQIEETQINGSTLCLECIGIGVGNSYGNLE